MPDSKDFELFFLRGKSIDDSVGSHDQFPNHRIPEFRHNSSQLGEGFEAFGFVNQSEAECFGTFSAVPRDEVNDVA